MPIAHQRGAETKNMFQGTHNAQRYFMDRWRRADPFDPQSEWIPGRYPPLRVNYTYSPFSRRAPSYATSDFWRTNVKFLKVRTMELSFNVPDRLPASVGLSGVRLFTNLSNPFSLDNTRLGVATEVRTAYLDLQIAEGTNDVNLQISQVETFINDGVDAIVLETGLGGRLDATNTVAPVAVSVITFVLALSQKLLIKDRLCREGAVGWARRGEFMGTGLLGKTLGQLGMGQGAAALGPVVDLRDEVAQHRAHLRLQFLGPDPLEHGFGGLLGIALLEREVGQVLVVVVVEQMGDVAVAAGAAGGRHDGPDAQLPAEKPEGLRQVHRTVAGHEVGDALRPEPAEVRRRRCS